MKETSFGCNYLRKDVVLEETYVTKKIPFALWSDPPTIDNPLGFLSSDIPYLHYHNDLEIGICYQGNSIFTIDNQTIECHAPCAAIIYPGQVHAAQSDPKNPAFWVFIYADRMLCSQDSLLHNTTSVFEEVSPAHCDLIALISMLVRRIQDGKQTNFSCAVSMLQTILLQHHQLEMPHSSHPISQITLDDIAPAITYISNHFQETCSVEELAKICCISVPTLRRKFMQTIGCSPNSYLHQVRIQNALSLLSNSTLSILEISAAVGYSSLSSFNRQFQKIVNSSPNEIRKNK